MLGVIGLPYQLIFIIATLGVTLLVEARGLFLTVASIPILFGIFTPLTSWFVSQQGVAANVSPGVSVTEILTAVYPLAQLFPTLIMVTLVAALIAVVRIILLRRNQESRQVSGELTRRAQREAEEANQNAARRARAQSTRVQSSKTRNRRAQPTGDTGSQVTVDELIRRSQERRQTVAQRQTERGVPFTPTPGPVVAPKRARAPLRRRLLRMWVSVDKQPLNAAPRSTMICTAKKSPLMWRGFFILAINSCGAAREAARKQSSQRRR